MEKLLNKLLADLVVEYHKLQSYHWYLKGYHSSTIIRNWKATMT